MDYTGLQPINDTAGAVNYTFNDFGYPDPSFSMVDGPPIQGTNTILLLSTPTPAAPLSFETTIIANKTNVVFNTPPQVAGETGPGLGASVNIPTASAGLQTLTINTPGTAGNNVALDELPSSVVTTYNGGGGETTRITGAGISAAATTTRLFGGPGQNTLTYDAGGLNPVVTPGALSGEVLITEPGSGTIDAVDYPQITIVNVGPLAIVPGAPRMISEVEGFDFADTTVGTFTLPLPPIFPAAPGPLPGFPASDFTASIDWSDPTPDTSAGTITQDAAAPIGYEIGGTHTFAQAGTYAVAPAIAFAGDTITAPVNGELVSVTFGPVAATAGATATATVTQSPLVLTVLPIVGTAGLVLPPAPIATFIDTGGANPVADYSATVSVVDPAGTTDILSGATITQNGDAAEYTVNAPALTFPAAGTYQVVVAITDNSATTPLTVDGAAQAVIADAALGPGIPLALKVSTGQVLSGAEVGTFTDANTFAAATGFTATIDWGDGTAPSIATIAADTATDTFDVVGTHAYALPGSYATTIVVTDAAGSTVTLSGTAAVADPALTGVPENFTAVAGQNTGPIVLATIVDPDPLATVSDLTATVNWGDPGGSSVTLPVVLAGGTPAGILFQVVGSHTYLDEGTYAVTVAVTTIGGATTTFTPATGTASVADAPIALGLGAPITGIEGAALPAGTVLATFTDSAPDAAVSDYSGTILWGDGSPAATFTSADVVSQGTQAGGRTFTVVTTAALTHTYDAAGSYALSFTINDVGGSQATGSTQAVIAAAPLAPQAAAGITGTAGTPLVAVGLATFTDPDPAAVAGDFRAVVDWGDGTPSSAGTIRSTTAGLFAVTGSHTYAEAEPAPYVVTVQVTDVDGSTGSTELTATVNEAALAGVSGSPVAATEGQPFQDLPVATFIDTNPLDLATDFTAAIDWGDGTTSPGTLAPLGIGNGGRELSSARQPHLHQFRRILHRRDTDRGRQRRDHAYADHGHGDSCRRPPALIGGDDRRDRGGGVDGTGGGFLRR